MPREQEHEHNDSQSPGQSAVEERAPAVTFSTAVVELQLEPAEEEAVGSLDSDPVDGFGLDGTVVCAVCLGRCSRAATLCAGDPTASDASANDAVDAIAATVAATAASTNAAAEDGGGPGTEAGQPDVEQGALLPPRSECQDRATTQTALRLQCNHVFHVECLSLWMTRGSNPTCPTCRAPVAPAALTPVQATSPEIRELITRTVSPPVRSIRWSLPERWRNGRQGPAATTLGSRWQCKQVVANLALHLAYPSALFGGIGGLMYLWWQL